MTHESIPRLILHLSTHLKCFMFMRNDYTLEIGRVSTVKIKKKCMMVLYTKFNGMICERLEEEFIVFNILENNFRIKTL